MNQITSCPQCKRPVPRSTEAEPPPAFCDACDWPLAWSVEESTPVAGGEPTIDVHDAPHGVDAWAWEREPRVGQRSCWHCSEPNARTATNCVLCGEPLDGPPRDAPAVRPPRIDACGGQESRNLISVPGPVLVSLGLLAVALFVVLFVLIAST